MSRLYRGLWRAQVRFPWDLTVELPALPVPYERAVEEADCSAQMGAVSALLVRVPGTRAPWEFTAPFEASDPPKWGEER